MRFEATTTGSTGQCFTTRLPLLFLVDHRKTGWNKSAFFSSSCGPQEKTIQLHIWRPYSSWPWSTFWMSRIRMAFISEDWKWLARKRWQVEKTLPLLTHRKSLFGFRLVYLQFILTDLMVKVKAIYISTDSKNWVMLHFAYVSVYLALSCARKLWKLWSAVFPDRKANWSEIAVEAAETKIYDFLKVNRCGQVFLAVWK